MFFINIFYTINTNFVLVQPILMRRDSSYSHCVARRRKRERERERPFVLTHR